MFIRPMVNDSIGYMTTEQFNTQKKHRNLGTLLYSFRWTCHPLHISKKVFSGLRDELSLMREPLYQPASNLSMKRKKTSPRYV